MCSSLSIENTSRNVFGNKNQCNVEKPNILKCEAIRRIKIILHEFNDTPFLAHKPKNQFNAMDKFASIFINNGYTNTSLLNDFHHIKHMHCADDDDYMFARIYEYFIDDIGTVCNGTVCLFIRMHYRDRSILQNETQGTDEYDPYDPGYRMDLISRIHGYRMDLISRIHGYRMDLI
eukprot:354000_1